MLPSAWSRTPRQREQDGPIIALDNHFLGDMGTLQLFAQVFNEALGGPGALLIELGLFRGQSVGHACPPSGFVSHAQRFVALYATIIPAGFVLSSMAIIVDNASALSSVK